MEENKVFWVIEESGKKWNVEANDIVEAANKAAEVVPASQIFQIIDIPG